MSSRVARCEHCGKVSLLQNGECVNRSRCIRVVRVRLQRTQETERNMMRTSRPRVTNPARAAYTMPHERIIEFSDDMAQSGGLISFLRIPGNDGRATLRVKVYSCDDDVEVIAPATAATEETHNLRRAVEDAARDLLGRLDLISTEAFSLGGEKKEREQLRAALTALEPEPITTLGDRAGTEVTC